MRHPWALLAPRSAPGRPRPVRGATFVPSPRPPERKPENARSIMLQPDFGPAAPFGSAAGARRIPEGEGERSRERCFGAPGPVQGAGRRKRSRRPGVSARVLFRADRQEIARPGDPGNGPGPGRERCGHRRCGRPARGRGDPEPSLFGWRRKRLPKSCRWGVASKEVGSSWYYPACVPVRGRPAVGAGTRRCRVGCRSSRHPYPTRMTCASPGCSRGGTSPGTRCGRGGTCR